MIPWEICAGTLGLLDNKLSGVEMDTQLRDPKFGLFSSHIPITLIVIFVEFDAQMMKK